jgi:hypothetical protein
MPQATVLVGFAEAMSAPEVVWSLVDAGFRVVAFARKGRASAIRHSRHVVCHEICAPESDLQLSMAELSSLLDSLNQADGAKLIVFPLDDKAVWLCSHLQISSDWILAGPTGACADLALDKNLQVTSARDAGFNVPETAVARTAKDLFEFSAAASYPIILKAVDSVPISDRKLYSCRKWICANDRELGSAIKQWKERVPLLAQNFITGVGEGVFGLATSEGVLAWSGHQRIRMMNPQGSGSSACISREVPAELRATAESFIKKAGWRGLFMIELLRDSSGKLWFVEINGRPWGSMALSRRQGFEYPAWHVQLALGGPTSAGSTTPTTRDLVCRNAGREFMHLLFVLKGAKSNALGQWPSFWKTLKDVVHVHRGGGLYNWRRDDPKVFLADFYYTVHNNLFKARD